MNTTTRSESRAARPRLRVLAGAVAAAALLTGLAATPANAATDGEARIAAVLNAEGIPGRAGDIITYSLKATNSGTATLNNVGVSSTSPVAPISLLWPGTPGTLQPGQAIVGQTYYQVTQSDIDAGHVAQTMVVSGVTSSGARVSQDVRIDVPVDSSPDFAGKTYVLVNKNSGKVLDVNASGEAVQATANRGASQRWTFVVDKGQTPFPSAKPVNIRNGASSDLLGIAGGWTHDGAGAIQWPDEDIADQSWSIVPTGDGYYQLVNNNSGKVLGIPAGSHVEGEKAIQWTNVHVDDQKWSLVVAG